MPVLPLRTSNETGEHEDEVEPSLQIISPQTPYFGVV